MLMNENLGGGLTEPAFDAHIQFLLNGWKVMKANDQDVSIAVLAYGKNRASESITYY